MINCQQQSEIKGVCCTHLGGKEWNIKGFRRNASWQLSHADESCKKNEAVRSPLLLTLTIGQEEWKTIRIYGS